MSHAIVNCATGEVEQRPLTADEQSNYAVLSEQAEQQAAAEEVQRANGDSLRQQARDSLTALRTSIDTLKAITDKVNADIGPRDTKDVARELRRTNRQLLALTKLFVGALEDADTGAG